MDDQLGLDDAALDGCVASCEAAARALSMPERAATPTLGGVTDLGARVDEFVVALTIACGVLAAAAESIGASAEACKQGSELIEAGAVAALAGVSGAER